MNAASTESGLAVVVGATGAFGQSIVARLIAQGLTVLAVARQTASLSALAQAHGPALRPCAADIARDEAIEQLTRAVDEADLPVRMVVHGPGVAVAGGILTAPTAALSEAVNIKVGGLLRVVRAVDHRLARGSRLVGIAGHYGLEPSAYAAAAGVANAALINAVRQLSLAYGERGITAHTLAPGPADTPRLRRVAEDRARLQGRSSEAVLADMVADSSLKQFTTPEQVAWAVSSLLDPAADAMTGSTWMLDAGRRRGLP